MIFLNEFFEKKKYDFEKESADDQKYIQFNYLACKELQAQAHKIKHVMLSLIISRRYILIP